MDWRLIKDPPLPGGVNMARDSALLLAFERGLSVRPTLRLYGWSEPTVSIGYAQDASPFSSSRLPVVRRITGGRAVLHQHEITYSIIAGVDFPLFSGGILGAYSAISLFLMAALKEAGVEASLARGSSKGGRSPACFLSPSRFEILSATGEKLVGSSQRRLKRAFLQHGSIILGVDEALTDEVFGTGVASRIGRVKALSGVDAGALKDAIIANAASLLDADFTEDALAPFEDGLEKELLSGRPEAGTVARL